MSRSEHEVPPATGGGPGRGFQAGRGLSFLPSRRADDRRRRGSGRRAADTRASADARLAQEQRRLAAEIHDLVMQDLSFALATMRSIAFAPACAAERAPGAISAAERALASARTIVAQLGERDLRPVAERVEQGARDAARGVPLSFSLAAVAEPGERAGQSTADALVHVAREAVTNAVKHGRARTVSVSLRHDSAWRLEVRDDGTGFDDRASDPGFGLSSMRLLTETLGGTFELSSAIGKGTEVAVSLP